jgi:hypothetical protein
MLDEPFEPTAKSAYNAAEAANSLDAQAAAHQTVFAEHAACQAAAAAVPSLPVVVACCGSLLYILTGLALQSSAQTKPAVAQVTKHALMINAAAVAGLCMQLMINCTAVTHQQSVLSLPRERASCGKACTSSSA